MAKTLKIEVAGSEVRVLGKYPRTYRVGDVLVPAAGKGRGGACRLLEIHEGSMTATLVSVDKDGKVAGAPRETSFQTMGHVYRPRGGLARLAPLKAIEPRDRSSPTGDSVTLTKADLRELMAAPEGYRQLFLRAVGA